MLIEMRRAKHTFSPTYSSLWTRYSWKNRSRTSGQIPLRFPWGFVQRAEVGRVAIRRQALAMT